MAVLRRRQALPALRRNLAHERALQSRMLLAAERSLEVTLSRALAAAGRRAAQAMRHGQQPAAAVERLETELALILKPAVTATARQFGARVIQAPKQLGAGIETKAAFDDLDAAIRQHTGDVTARRVVQISDSLRETIRRTVERAIAENLGEEATAEAIVEATGGEIAMARARRIARTEIHNAAMYGQQAAAEASPLAFEKVWLATEDSRTRPAHAKANGQRVALGDHFVLEDEDGRTYHMAYPGDARAPAGQVINCFPAGTKVSGAVRAATRHWFDGELVEITTARGHKLAGTPNHPVLSAEGWVALSALREGDHVVGRRDLWHQGAVAGAVAEHVEDVEPGIEQVFDALAIARLPVRKPRLAVNFHGDRPAEDVDVVWSDRVLRYGRQATVLQHAGKLPLGRANLAQRDSFAARLAFQLEAAGRLRAARMVRRLRQRLAAVGTGSSHPQSHGVAAAPRSAPRGAKAIVDHVALFAHRLGDCLHRLAAVEPVQDLVAVGIPKSVQVREGGVTTGPHHGGAFKPVLHRADRPADGLRDLIKAHAAEVELDRVVTVTRRRFAGHVFNLEAVDGTYIAGGIVAHNCRCVCLYEPIIGDTAPATDRAPIEIVEQPDRPVDIDLDEPAQEAVLEDVPFERDLTARPYEREAMVLWASGDGLNLNIDGTPRVGQVVRLIGPNDLYHSADTPEVDRAVARQASGVLLQPSTWFRRPQLWRVVVPAGPLLPEGLFAPGGHGVTVTSGVGRYGLVTLTIDRVTNTTWGAEVPKPLIWIDDAGVRATIEGALANLETVTARETAEFVLRSLEGQRLLDADRGEELRTVPLSVMRTLNATAWNKRSLRLYLENLLNGFLQDTPEVGEPATDARVILVEATMNIADALGDRTEE